MIVSGILQFLPRIERSVSLLHYYNDSISEQDMKRISAYRYEDNGNIYENGKLRIHMVAPTSGNKTPLYVMEAELSNSKLLSFIRGGSNDEAYALAGPDWVISDPSEEDIQAAVEKIRQQTEEAGSFVLDHCLFAYRRLSLCDGWMISYTGTENLLESARIFNIFTVVTLLMTAVIILAVVFVLSRDIDRPFQQLLRLFGEVEAGSLEVKTDYQFQDEFVVVFDQFDRMIFRIKELLSQSVEQEKEIQRAEYRQLQAHIAPHFLYNSFNVLRHCVLLEDYETASEMTRLLGNYFRYMTYGGEQESISLLEEYQHAEDYLDIQKIRFQDNIVIEIDELPEKYHDLRVPPFILQPLVENVFKHGIKDLAYSGRISVRVMEGEKELDLLVRDNGAGMSIEALEQLKRAVNGEIFIPEHSGMVNIGKRLKILLGDEAGLFVDSEKNVFFEALIRIPLGVQKVCKEAVHD